MGRAIGKGVEKMGEATSGQVINDCLGSTSLHLCRTWTALPIPEMACHSRSWQHMHKSSLDALLYIVLIHNLLLTHILLLQIARLMQEGQLVLHFADIQLHRLTSVMHCLRLAMFTSLLLLHRVTLRRTSCPPSSSTRTT